VSDFATPFSLAGISGDAKTPEVSTNDEVYCFASKALILPQQIIYQWLACVFGPPNALP
jgi:hypothetical protein